MPHLWGKDGQDEALEEMGVDSTSDQYRELGEGCIDGGDNPSQKDTCIEHVVKPALKPSGLQSD